MGQVLITGLMEEATLEVGRTIKWTDLVSTSPQAARLTKDNIRATLRTGMEYSSGLTAEYTLDGGKRVSNTERVFIPILKESVVRVCGKTVKENIGSKRTEYTIIIRNL